MELVCLEMRHGNIDRHASCPFFWSFIQDPRPSKRSLRQSTQIINSEAHRRRTLPDSEASFSFLCCV